MKTKKILFILLLLTTLFCINSCAMHADCTVYVTETGHAYHKSSCGSIKRSRHVYSMLRSEAEGRGYSQCSKCRP